MRAWGKALEVYAQRCTTKEHGLAVKETAGHHRDRVAAKYKELLGESWTMLAAGTCPKARGVKGSA